MQRSPSGSEAQSTPGGLECSPLPACMGLTIRTVLGQPWGLGHTALGSISGLLLPQGPLGWYPLRPVGWESDTLRHSTDGWIFHRGSSMCRWGDWGSRGALLSGPRPGCGELGLTPCRGLQPGCPPYRGAGRTGRRWPKDWKHPHLEGPWGPGALSHPGARLPPQPVAHVGD